MAESSKEVDPVVDAEAKKEVIEEVKKQAAAEDDEEESGEDEPVGGAATGEPSTGDVGASSKAKKKKSKRAKIKKAIGLGGGEGSSAHPASKLTPEMVEQLLEMNPSLKGEVAGMDHAKAVEALKKMDVADLLTGMSVSGKNQKDMASYKFWQTQPVPRFDDSANASQGPIEMIDPAKVPKEPRPMVEGFDWVIMDLTDRKEIDEVHELLTGHYVEDDEARFRLMYSAPFLDWALKSPGWRKEWHIGVRATKSRKLVAFISGVPTDIRVRSKVLKTTEINFLCVHKKLRSKRLAPTLIAEITRQCYLNGIYQAIYTAGIVLPKPVSSCRYFHRPLDWMKLFDIGFSGLPHGSTPARQVAKNRVPTAPTVPGLRPMESKDVKEVQILLKRYLKQFDIAPEYTEAEIEHWLVNRATTPSEQVVWSYVVEDPKTKKITDFFSFYMLESRVIGNAKYDTLKAAYLFYYATESALGKEKDVRALKERLNALIVDALVIAKQFNFDVFNALTLLDNPLFLEQQKFGEGDGQLHYYLFNYRTPPIAGGVDKNNKVDDNKRGGVGVVML